MKRTQEAELITENQPTYQASALVVQPQQPLDVARPSAELNLQSIADRILSGDLTSEKLTMIKDLVAMDAERKFAASFSMLQSELPTIVASSVIPNRGKYEKFEDIMRQIQPVLNKHGFSVSFSQEVGENRITELCHLSHIGGHSRTSKFTCRVARADSETQSDVKAATTAKRKALQDALNIVIRQDCLNDEDDPRNEGGGNVTRDKAEELERRVAETNSDKVAFLKLAGADSYATILASKYDMLDSMLRKKEQRR